MKTYYVYVLTNTSRTVFYIGVTNDPTRRYFEHTNKTDPNSFTAKYHLTVLIFTESFSDIHAAIQAEKIMKKWRREKKLALIRMQNPTLKDLMT